jgi:ribonuclease J
MTHITIHRGTSQIGGCVTEITTATSRVFIDFGDNLPGSDTPSLPVEGLTTGDGTNSALFFTHYHGDHIGRLADVLPGVPVFMGKTAKAIQTNYLERVKNDALPLVERMKTFAPLDCIAVGDIVVTPLMIDHSAFDSYMFVIEAGGKRILHTGDFRLHGIRGGKTLKILACYARDIDYIVCEGTAIARDGEPPMTEHELRRKAAVLMAGAKYVFVLCSSTHIDRIGAFYHANPKGRLFVCDVYQKKQLETVRESHADKSSFYDFKRVYSYAPNLDKHMEEQGFCMLVRQGETFRRVMEKYKDDCLVIHSMWTGYLDDRAKNQGLVDFLAPYRERNVFRVLHTSGHASAADIRALYTAVKPKNGLIPIHTDAPERFEKINPDGTVILLKDGEGYKL